MVGAFVDKKYTPAYVEKKLQDIVDGYNKMAGTNYQVEDIATVSRVDEKMINQMIKYACDWDEKKLKDVPRDVIERCEKLKGKVVIDTTEDNSIPWDISQLIESLLAAERWHWG